MKEFNQMVEAYNGYENVFKLWCSFTTVQRQEVAKFLGVHFNYSLILEQVEIKAHEVL